MADSTQTEKPSLGAGGVGLTMLELDMSGADDEQLVSQIAAPPADPGLAYRRKQRVGAIAGVALIVLVAAGVAVAVLVSGSSSPSLKVPEEFSGEFTKYDRYTNEKVTGRIHKSVSATGKSVIEGTLSYTMDDGNRAVVTLLDHRAYIEVFNDTVSATVPQRVTCMPPNLVPPFGDVDEVFSTSSLVPVEHLDESNPGTAQCAEAGHRWLIKWGVQEFLYCQPSDDVHRLSSDNFHAQFVADPYVQRPSLSIPTNITTGQPAQCDKLEEFSVLDGGVSHHGLAIQRRILRQERRLTAARPCVFVGGLGLKSNGNPTTSDNAYWGSTLKATLASQCSSFAFVQRDMKGKGWDDSAHATAFCSAAGVGTGGTISNTLVFSHGSGSLVVANALFSNACSFHSNTRWYSAMAPFGGAKAADEAKDNLCASYSSMSSILDHLTFCKGKNHDKLHAGCSSIKSTYPGSSVTLDEVRDIARTHLDGAMCGHDSFGLYTGVGQGLNDFDSAIWFGEDRDGMMKLSQCTTVHTGSWTESNSKTAVWANQHLNYLDGTGRWGDASIDVWGDHSPVTWYLTMAQRP